MSAEGHHADHKTARMAISPEGFIPWTIARDTKEHIRCLGWEKLHHRTFQSQSCPSDFRLFPALKSA
ncbi:hypothetical protein AVEN_96531-1, partial [Araneus ventricosus]